MPPPSIRILGAFMVRPTPELLASAMEVKYGDLDLDPADLESATGEVRRELASIALIEAEVRGADDAFDVGDFGQPESEQAPYDEAFLSLDGERILSRFERPREPDFRVAFFLHFFDPSRPLSTSYGEVPVPAPSEMTERLARLVPYEPVG